MCLPPSSGKRYRGTADPVFQNLYTIEEGSAEYVLIVSGAQVYQMDYAELLRRHVTSGADLKIAAVEYPVGRAASRRYRSGFRRSHRYGPIHWLVRGKASRRDSSRQCSARFSSWLFIE
jgi:hypothetical protein